MCLSQHSISRVPTVCQALCEALESQRCGMWLLPHFQSPFSPPGFLYAWAGQHRVDLAFAATGHTHLGIAALKTFPALLLCMSLRLNQTLLQRQKTHGLPKPFIKRQ